MCPSLFRGGPQRPRPHFVRDSQVYGYSKCACRRPHQTDAKTRVLCCLVWWRLICLAVCLSDWRSNVSTTHKYTDTQRPTCTINCIQNVCVCECVRERRVNTVLQSRPRYANLIALACACVRMCVCVVAVVFVVFGEAQQQSPLDSVQNICGGEPTA